MTLDSFRLYVGGLSVNITDDILEEIFGQYGRVNFVKIVRDYTSGRTKGFGFVEMSSFKEAQSAIQGLNGQELGGQKINIKIVEEGDAGVPISIQH